MIQHIIDDVYLNKFNGEWRFTVRRKWLRVRWVVTKRRDHPGEPQITVSSPWRWSREAALGALVLNLARSQYVGEDAL